jgi:nucleotide-binding universal stress UspA family protein
MMIKRAVVAVDGSKHAGRALDLACEVASRLGVELVAVHVISDQPLSAAEREMAKVEFQDEIARGFDLAPPLDARSDLRLTDQRLAEHAAVTGRRFRLALGERLVGGAARHAEAQGVRNLRTVLREGDPAAAILEVAKQEGADLIVMGRRGLGDLAGLLLGSVTHKVTHLADCACLTVK